MYKTKLNSEQTNHAKHATYTILHTSNIFACIKYV